MPFELKQGRNDLFPAAGVEHCGGLVKNHARGLHCEDSRNRYTLLLTARELVRRVRAVLVHTDGSQRVVHPLSEFRGLNTEVLGSEGYVLLDDARDKLVVGVLEHQTDVAPYLEGHLLIGGYHFVHHNNSLVGKQHGVKHF